MYNNINANDDGANTYIRTNTLHTRTHTPTHKHTHTRTHTHTRLHAYTYRCIAHIIIIFRTPLYCLRVSHMHDAPSLMVLTIWMQISERKPPKGFGVRRAQQYYNFVPHTRRRRRLRTAGRHQIFYANFHDIFRFPNNYYCFRPRTNPMPESYDRLTRDRLVHIILFIFAGN